MAKAPQGQNAKQKLPDLSPEERAVMDRILPYIEARIRADAMRDALQAVGALLEVQARHMNGQLRPYGQAAVDKIKALQVEPAADQED